MGQRFIRIEMKLLPRKKPGLTHHAPPPLLPNALLLVCLVLAAARGGGAVMLWHIYSGNI